VQNVLLERHRTAAVLHCVIVIVDRTWLTPHVDGLGRRHTEVDRGDFILPVEQARRYTFIVGERAYVRTTNEARPWLYGQRLVETTARPARPLAGSLGGRTDQLLSPGRAAPLLLNFDHFTGAPVIYLVATQHRADRARKQRHAI